MSTWLLMLQFVTFVLPLPPSWGVVDVRTKIELDGDPATVEAVVWSLEDFTYRVAKFKPDGTLCATQTFYWLGDMYIYPTFDEKAGISYAYAVVNGHYVEFYIPRPPC